MVFPRYFSQQILKLKSQEHIFIFHLLYVFDSYIGKSEHWIRHSKGNEKKYRKQENMPGEMKSVKCLGEIDAKNNGKVTKLCLRVQGGRLIYHSGIRKTT
jgi:hypothetical protein